MRALYTAASGMSAQQLRLDTIANNLANVASTGFKRSRDSFQDLFYQQLTSGGQAVSAARMELGTGTRIVAVERDHTQGNLVSTGNVLHVALQGDGFFVLEGMDGVPMYTRDGTFSQDADGYMISAGGLRVGGDIQVPEDATSVRIDYDGTVHAVFSDASRDVVLGQIEVVKFLNPAGLRAIGNNFLVPTLTSGDPMDVVAGTDTQVVQGYLETSNVDVATELIEMIQAQRLYEMNSKVVQAADETLGVAANLRR